MQPSSRGRLRLTAESPNWALYYRMQDGRPREFCEIRRVGSAVWVRSGGVNTWGTRESTAYGSSEAADAGFRTVGREKSAEGFVLTREGVYDPSRFDYDQLREELREGVRKAFTAVRDAHAGENVNAFALVSDGSAMTIDVAANSEEALSRNDEDDDYRWNPDEWPYSEGGEFLDIAYRLLLTQHQDLPSEIPFEDFQEGVFEAGVRALEELDQEGFFGSGPARDTVILLFHVTDADPLEDAARRLNTPAQYQRYHAWWQSWNED